MALSFKVDRLLVALIFVLVLALISLPSYASEQTPVPDGYAPLPDNFLDETLDTTGISLDEALDYNDNAVSRGDSQSCIAHDAQGRFMGWVDYQHCVVSSRTMRFARRVDDMFGDWHDDEARMQIRLINELAWDDLDGESLNPSIKASADLPNMNRRLRLVISDERDDLTDSSTQNLRDRSSNTTAALRFIPVALDRLRIDTDLGVRSGFDPYVRARYRNSWGLTRSSAFRVGQTLQYAVDDKARANSQLDIERLLNESIVFRFSNALSYKQKEFAEDGVRWGSGVSISHWLNKSDSIGYGTSVDGVTRPSFHRESYGIWIAYRSRLWRDWLYYEVEPRWTRYRYLGWDAVHSIELRLEAQFGK